MKPLQPCPGLEKSHHNDMIHIYLIYSGRRASVAAVLVTEGEDLQKTR